MKIRKLTKVNENLQHLFWQMWKKINLAGINFCRLKKNLNLAGRNFGRFWWFLNKSVNSTKISYLASIVVKIFDSSSEIKI